MITIDEREPQKIFNIAKRFDLKHDRATLLVGDFLCEEKGICIERKSFPDYVQSLQSGHLQEQLLNMQDNFSRNYLIISGKHEDCFFDPNLRKFTVEHWLGSLASFAVRYNVKILQVANDTQLVKLVKKIVDKTDDGKSPQKEIIRRVQSKEDVYLSMLCCVHGISIEKAKAIKNEYPIFSMFMDALKMDMFSVKGIGEKLLGNLNDAFCGEDT